MTNHYQITRHVNGVVALDGNGKQIPLRLDLFNHSPDGFEFGYGGSGPSQLALAILADYTSNDDMALSWYHDFKQKFIVPPRGTSFSIQYDDIDAFLKRKKEALR